MSHNHDHHHNHDHASKNLRLAFFINLVFTILEIIGGIYTNSIAILSDAVHDLGDSLSLGTAWYLQKKSEQEADQKYSYGYRRFSLLGALITGLILLSGSVYVIYEAVGRFIEPEYANPDGMLLFAILGIAVNGYAAWKLSKGNTMNEKMVSWHLMEDVLGWVAILIVSIVLQFADIRYLDPALSVLITLYILWNSLKRLKETLFLFLQGQPKDIDRAEVEETICAVNGVDRVYHTHIWSLDGEKHVLTIHVKLKKIADIEELIVVKKAIKEALKPYKFEHCNIETELTNESDQLESTDCLDENEKEHG